MKLKQESYKRLEKEVDSYFTAKRINLRQEFKRRLRDKLYFLEEDRKRWNSNLLEDILVHARMRLNSGRSVVREDKLNILDVYLKDFGFVEYADNGGRVYRRMIDEEMEEFTREVKLFDYWVTEKGNEFYNKYLGGKNE
jgi:hypothetical protein